MWFCRIKFGCLFKGKGIEIIIIDRLLTLEDGELTPTLKVVRKVVLNNFSNSIEKIYS